MSHGLEYLRSAEKRRLDVAGALCLGALAVAPCAVVATTLAHELKIPLKDALLEQERVGPGGEPLKVLKLRTLPKVASSQPLITYGAYDPRARKLGGLIRRSGFDEVPQLLNVLRGDMSLVGPRPLLPQDFEWWRTADPTLFDEWKATVYDQVKPGIYGPSQLMRRRHRESTLTVFAGSMRTDLEYVDEASLGGDIRLLAGAPIDILRATTHAPRPPAE